MLMPFQGDGTRPCVLLLEPNATLRRAIFDVLAAEEYDVEACESLEQVIRRGDGDSGKVALVAWQAMDGMLADNRREQLTELTRRVRLVLMVPRRWRRLLDDSEFGFAGLVSKPFDADELLDGLQQALTRAAQPTPIPEPAREREGELSS
jgi:DNA-binding response OmpR family regulator